MPEIGYGFVRDLHKKLLTISGGQRLAVFRIRISFYVDPNPGSQKCPYGSGSKGINTEEEKIDKNFQINLSK